MKDAIYSYENNIKCPHCGYEDIDSWEYDDDCGKNECGSCGKAFEYMRNVDVTYSTYILTCEKPEDHDWVLITARRKTKKYSNGSWLSLPDKDHTPYLVYECSKCKKQNYVHDVTEDKYEEALLQLLKVSSYDGKHYIKKDNDGRYHSNNIEVTQNMLNRFEHQLEGDLNWVKII